MRTYDELAERVLARRNEYFKKQKEQRRITCTAAVSCLILAAAVWAGARLPHAANVSRDPAVDPTVEPSLPATDDAPDRQTGPVTQPGPAVTPPSTFVTGYGPGGGSTCYAAPENGDVNLSIPLRDALEAYGDGVQYVIFPDFFLDGHPKPTSSPEVLELIEQLCAEGYSCGHSATTPDIITLNLTASEIRAFTAPDGWGLMFFLLDERVG